MTLIRESAAPRGAVALSPETVAHVEQYDSVLEVIDEAASVTWETDGYWSEIKATATSIIASIDEIEPQVMRILAAHQGVATLGPSGQSERSRRRSDGRTTGMIRSSTRDAMSYARGCVLNDDISLEGVRNKQLQGARSGIEQTYFQVLKKMDAAKEITNIMLAPVERSYEELGPLFQKTVKPENDSVNYIYTYMLLHPEGLADFVDWIESVSNGSDASQIPMLITLANDVVDQNGGAYFSRYFNSLLKEAVELDVKEDFANYITQQLAEDEESDDLATLRLMRQFFSGDNDEFAQKLLSLSEMWDEDLQNRYSDFRKALVLQAQFRIAEALKPYVRRSRFVNVAAGRSDAAVLTGEQRARRNKSNAGKKGGRVTSKKQSQSVQVEGDSDDSEVESATTLRGVSVLKRIPGGFVEQEFSDDEIGQMLNQYHKEQGREPKLLEDLQAILGSILEQPMGKGATKYQGIKLNIGGKFHTLLHFSPFHRPGLSLQTPTGNKTRFTYVLTQASDGGYNLAVLGIFHKNDIDDPTAINRIVNS